MTLYQEPTVARVSGIRKGLLAETRKTTCAKGPDWVLDNGVVAYTPSGLKKICAELKLDQAGLEEGLQEAAPANERSASEAATAAATEASTGDVEASRQDIADELTHSDGQTIDISPGTPAAVLLAAGATPTKLLGVEKFPAGLPAELPEQPAAAGKDQPVAAVPGAAGVIGRGVTRAAAEELVEVVITSVPVNGNKRLLYGTVEDLAATSGRRRVSVRVRDNAFFLAGFVIRAAPGGPNYYNFVGRLPRWKGDRFGFTAKPKEPDAAAS